MIKSDFTIGKPGEPLTDQQTEYSRDLVEKSYNQDYEHRSMVRLRVVWSLEDYYGRTTDVQRAKLHERWDREQHAPDPSTQARNP